MCASEIEIAIRLFMAVRDTGGATVAVAQCEHGDATLAVASGVQPEGGYVVAIEGDPVSTIPEDQWSYRMAMAVIGAMTEQGGLSTFLLTNPFSGCEIRHDKGAGAVLFDAVEVYQDKTVALTVAADRGHEAIHDLAMGEDILVR